MSQFLLTLLGGLLAAAILSTAGSFTPHTAPITFSTGVRFTCASSSLSRATNKLRTISCCCSGSYIARCNNLNSQRESPLPLKLQSQWRLRSVAENGGEERRTLPSKLTMQSIEEMDLEELLEVAKAEDAEWLRSVLSESVQQMLLDANRVKQPAINSSESAVAASLETQSPITERDTVSMSMVDSDVVQRQHRQRQQVEEESGSALNESDTYDNNDTNTQLKTGAVVSATTRSATDDPQLPASAYLPNSEATTAASTTTPVSATAASTTRSKSPPTEESIYPSPLDLDELLDLGYSSDEIKAMKPSVLALILDNVVERPSGRLPLPWLQTTTSNKSPQQQSQRQQTQQLQQQQQQQQQMQPRRPKKQMEEPSYDFSVEDKFIKRRSATAPTSPTSTPSSAATAADAITTSPSAAATVTADGSSDPPRRRAVSATRQRRAAAVGLTDDEDIGNAFRWKGIPIRDEEKELAYNLNTAASPDILAASSSKSKFRRGRPTPPLPLQQQQQQPSATKAPGLEDQRPRSRSNSRSSRRDADDFAETQSSVHQYGRLLSDSRSRRKYNIGYVDAAAEDDDDNDDDEDSSFWPSADEFKDMLLEESEFRMDIIGDWVSPLLRAENKWRFKLYEGWRQFLDEGFGDAFDVVDDDLFEPATAASGDGVRSFGGDSSSTDSDFFEEDDNFDFDDDTISRSSRNSFRRQQQQQLSADEGPDRSRRRASGAGFTSSNSNQVRSRKYQQQLDQMRDDVLWDVQQQARRGGGSSSGIGSSSSNSGSSQRRVARTGERQTDRGLNKDQWFGDELLDSDFDDYDRSFEARSAPSNPSNSRLKGSNSSSRSSGESSGRRDRMEAARDDYYAEDDFAAVAEELDGFADSEDAWKASAERRMIDTFPPTRIPSTTTAAAVPSSMQQQRQQQQQQQQQEEKEELRRALDGAVRRRSPPPPLENDSP